MFSLITNFLEPICYLIYTGIFMSVFFLERSSSRTVLLFYYFFAFITIFYACLLAHVNTWGDNNWLYNLFFFVTIIVLSYYFFNLIDSRNKKTAILVILLVNVGLFIWHDIISQKFYDNYNHYVVAVCFLSIIIYSFLYFHQLVTNVGHRNILIDFDFWLVSGYLLYFLGAFFAILFYKNASIEQRAILWGLQNIVLFLSALITLSGNLWISHKKKLA